MDNANGELIIESSVLAGLSLTLTATDLKNMNLWRPITDFLDDPEEDMRLQACWVLGTAVQVSISTLCSNRQSAKIEANLSMHPFIEQPQITRSILSTRSSSQTARTTPTRFLI